MSTPEANRPLTGDDGWIEWTGGENPVPGQMVEVEFRDGSQFAEESSDSWEWDHYPDRRAPEHEQGSADIIAYRLARPTQPEPVCSGCEGHPAPENNPCAVCGRSAQPEPAGMRIDGCFFDNYPQGVGFFVAHHPEMFEGKRPFPEVAQPEPERDGAVERLRAATGPEYLGPTLVPGCGEVTWADLRTVLSLLSTAERQRDALAVALGHISKDSPEQKSPPARWPQTYRGGFDAAHSWAAAIARQALQSIGSGE